MMYIISHTCNLLRCAIISLEKGPYPTIVNALTLNTYSVSLVSPVTV